MKGKEIKFSRWKKAPFFVSSFPIFIQYNLAPNELSFSTQKEIPCYLKRVWFQPCEWMNTLNWQCPAARRHPIFPLAERPGASDLHWWERPDTRNPTASSVSSSSSLQHHVTGFNAWMQKPNWGDLGMGYICKSVKIFLQDRKYAGITLWLGY